MARKNIFSFSSDGNGNANPFPSTEPTEVAALFKNFEDSRVGWFWATDEQGNLTYISHSLGEDIGCEPKALLGSPLANLFEVSDNNMSVRERLPFVIGRRASFDKMAMQSSGSNGPIYWELTGRPRQDSAGNFKGYLGFTINVTEQMQLSESTSKLAMYDELTGLSNRLSMSKFLDLHTSGLERNGRSCTLILIDLDRFKAVNDTLGHPAGDALLKQVAGRLLRIIKDKEKVFRLGGDEFQIILPDCNDRARLSEIARDIIDSLSQPYSVDGNRCYIGASLGLAIGPQDGFSREDLMRNADLALYTAKDSGRGCFRFFSNTMLKETEERGKLEDDLRTALANGELSLFYQPIVSSQDNCVTGVEALIRWTHPTRGPISPALFIPIAEAANLIEKLGEWVLRKACDDAVTWPADIRVAVNVSPIQFANENLPTLVMSALANSGISPDRLEIELTEGVFLSESTETDEMFAKLKSLGVRLVLDDFGTGYSSLAYLKTAPFDKIKIDQSFVRGATLPGSRNGAIIAAIVALAGALDMETTAEGIETFDQLELIHALGVSHVQGYIYSQAISSDELNQLLEAGEWMINPKGPSKQRSDRRAMYRKVGAILGGQYHVVLIRNLSETGAFIEGLPDAPIDTQLIIDFGSCQLAVATVRRIHPRGHGIEFGEPLISDGNGELSTRTTVNPYMLAKMGMSSSSQIEATRMLSVSGSGGVPTLASTLGLAMPASNASDSDGMAVLGGLGGSEFGGGGLGSGVSQTFNEHSHQTVQQIFAAHNPLQSMSLLNMGTANARHLKAEEWDRLKKAVEESQNSQLKYIIALVVLTGTRFQELLSAVWSDVNLDSRMWSVRSAEGGKSRQIRLPLAVIDIFNLLPRAEGCDHIFINPRTKKPFNSIFGSWDAARRKACLDSLSVHDLRNSIKRNW